MAKKKGPKAGRAKQKQKAQRAGDGGASSWASSMQQHGRMIHSDDEDDYDAPRTMFRGFDGNTTRHVTTINPSIRLRHRSIAFVSAGTNMPLGSDDLVEAVEEHIVAIEEAEDNDTIMEDNNQSAAGELSGTAADVNTVADTLNILCQISGLDGASDSLSQPADETLAFVVDTTGDMSLAATTATTSMSLPLRAASPTLPASDDEVVVFRGRKKATIIEDGFPESATVPVTKPKVVPPHLRQRSNDNHSVLQPQSRDHSIGDSPSKKKVIPPHLRSEQIVELPKQTNGGQTWTSKPAEPTSTADSAWTPAPQGAWWRVKEDAATAEKDAGNAVQEKGVPAEVQQMARECAEASIDILRTKWVQSSRAEQRSRTRQAGNSRIQQNQTGRTRREQQRQEMVSEPSSSDSEEEAYRDYMENLKQQMELGPTAILVQEEPGLHANGSETVDTEEAAEWEDTDASSFEQEDQIGQDADDVYGHDSQEDISPSNSSELEAAITAAQRDLERAEDALSKKRQEAMSDEHLARLLAKQEELGYDTDELIIDDGHLVYSQADGAYGDLSAARSAEKDFLSLAKNGKKSRRNQRQQKGFADASALADAVDQYGNDGFDIMDFERPCLRPTKRGRKGALPVDLEALSDEELRQGLLSSWDKDRDKKRMKKAERENLRSMGMLGSKNGKADLNQKYRQGMTVAEIKQELEDFLDNDEQTTRAFPPMDNSDRAVLHQVARMLGLKSKSIGAGDARAPVLYKTKATATRGSNAVLNKAMSMLNRRFLRNQSFHGKVANKGLSATKIKRSGGTAGNGLRHGELVGAGAQEIGKENFGHKMLEKMGWNPGTALGRDGEGRLHPVEQIMRIGKSGLG